MPTSDPTPRRAARRQPIGDPRLAVVAARLALLAADVAGLDAAIDLLADGNARDSLAGGATMLRTVIDEVETRLEEAAANQ